MKRWTVLLAIAALSSVVMAQGQGRGMMMGRGGASETMLLGRADVQRDLALTEDQKTKLTAMQSKMREDMQAAMENARSSGNFDREAMQKAMADMMAKSKKETSAILTADQNKRLHEIWIQVAGNAVLLDEGVQKDLGLTAEQKTKIKDLQAKQNEANQAVFQKMQDGEIDRSEIQGIMKKNSDTLNVELGKVLTEDQRTKLKAMGGKPFKADPTQNGG